MNNFTEEEIRVAKQVKDALVNGDLAEELRSVYIAGEIVMWDELRNQSPSGANVLVDQLQGLCREYLQVIESHKEFSNNAYANMNPKAADMWRHKSDGLVRAERDIRALLAQYNAATPQTPIDREPGGIDGMGNDPL